MFKKLSLRKCKQKYSVSVMSVKQKGVFWFFLLLWALSLGSFWRWWLEPSHVVTAPTFIFNTLLLIWFTGQVGWYLFFVGRMREPDPECDVPRGRVAIIVTKAPSEPWPVVQQTLEWMRLQDFSYEYDVWLADESPSTEVYKWCAANDVNISCRRDISGYHNQKWPRRTRCKEGNLAFFYDKFGYENYDYVVQLDADHVPSPTYLKEMVRPFADPRVGYVAAPSICDKNADESWAARSRLYAEASMHGSLQAGYHDGFAPLCIGSHYAVRTAALKQAGGLGPELAEDHSTTLLISAAGWKGAFAFQAFAHGDGPACLPDLVTQEFQWCRSLVNVFLNWLPKYWGQLPARLKVEFAFAELWYVLLSLTMLAGHALPVIALVTRTPWANVSLLEYYAYAIGLTMITAALGDWVRKNGWFRPVDAKLISWEMMLFQLIRWPWTLLGVVYAVVDTVTKKEFAFKVTPKGVVGARPLPAKVLLPYLVIAAIEAGTALLVPDAGRATGYYYLAITCAIAYTVATLTVIGLHVYENREWVRLPRLTLPGIASSAPDLDPAHVSWTSLVGKPALQAAAVLAIALAALALRRDRVAYAVLPPQTQVALAEQAELMRTLVTAAP